MKRSRWPPFAYGPDFCPPTALGKAFTNYQKLLFGTSRIDFGHQQKLVCDLLADTDVRQRVCENVRFVMVDEYQDTNYVQEQVLGALSSRNGNMCVVGDEDQGLYRFRGATVRNILEFPDRFPGARIIKLTTNYRSHGKIIQAYDRWMSSADWSNSAGRPFRYDKTIQPD